MQAAVLYRSTSGFTKKYAQWIAEELKADLYDAKTFDAALFSRYQVVIYGASLHAVGISGIELIKQNLAELADKKIIVFAVGASPPRENVLDEVKNKNFTAEQQQQIAFFYLRGGFDYSKLDWVSKVLMTLMKAKIKLKRKAKRSADEVGMLTALSKPVDFARKENIAPIVECARLET